jgi:hypothetical protein
VHSANAVARSPPPACASPSAAATSPTAHGISIAGVGSGTEPGAPQPLRPLLHASPYLPALESLRARVCVLRLYRSLTYALLAAAVAFCVGFTIVCVLQAQRLTGQSDWMSVVWSFMCAKWALGIVLHLSSVNPFHPHTIGSGVTTADAPASSTASTALLSAGGDTDSYRGGGYGSVPARGYADDNETDAGNTRGGIRAPRSMPFRMDHNGTGSNTNSRIASRTSSFSGGGGFPNQLTNGSGSASLPGAAPSSSRRVSLSSNGGALASASTTPISGSYLGGVDAGSDAYVAFASVRPGTTPPLAAHRKSSVVAIGEV